MGEMVVGGVGVCGIDYDCLGLLFWRINEERYWVVGKWCLLNLEVNYLFKIMWDVGFLKRKCKVDIRFLK